MDDADETMFLALMLSLIVFVFLPLTGVLLATSSGCTLLAAGDLMLHQKACLWGSWSVVGLCLNMFGWGPGLPKTTVEGALQHQLEQARFINSEQRFRAESGTSTAPRLAHHQSAAGDSGGVGGAAQPSNGSQQRPIVAFIDPLEHDDLGAAAAPSPDLPPFWATIAAGRLCQEIVIFSADGRRVGTHEPEFASVQRQLTN